MSRNTNNNLNNSYWESQGLKSLLNRFMELRQSLETPSADLHARWCERTRACPPLLLDY